MPKKNKIFFYINIRQRIYLSFSLLVILFAINAVLTINTLNSNRKLSNYISDEAGPMLQSLDDFKKMMLESKMYATNWVFLRANEEDKNSLRKLHNSDYAILKLHINSFAIKWTNKNWIDSLNAVYRGFEHLLVIEKDIMHSLKKFEDYDDPVIKLEAERKIEEEILPLSASLITTLDHIYWHGQVVKEQQNIKLQHSSMRLRVLIFILAITIVGAGLFLSLYLTRIIIGPINKLKTIINDLGKGITRKITYHSKKDEISEMVQSVNNLSEKLSATAAFASEVGNRNFDVYYEPLSSEDTLGRALIAMRDNLRDSETSLKMKNKELEQFAYVASHDLQEPLRTISSFVELLEKRYRDKLDENANKFLTYIIQSSDRMKILIKDLLDYSRIGAKKELVSINSSKILKEVLTDLDVAIGESKANIEAGALPVVNGYSTEIKQLFQNLIVNAVKFRKKEQPPQIKISAERNNGHWQFAFEDNGIGIEEEHQERIFIIFQRLHTRNEYEGSGIGLAHCKKIVELHGGNIWVKSKPGSGTTFYFTLPA